MGFPNMVIVRMGLCSDSVERFPNKLSYDEIFKMNSSVWRDVRSWNGSRSRIVGLHEGNRVWRLSPDTKALIANKLRVSRVRSWLSSVPDLWLDLQLSASDLPMVFPGRWGRRKSNLASSNDHRACLWFSFLVIIKYSRFLWSVQISNWCAKAFGKS